MRPPAPSSCLQPTLPCGHSPVPAPLPHPRPFFGGKPPASFFPSCTHRSPFLPSHMQHPWPPRPGCALGHPSPHRAMPLGAGRGENGHGGLCPLRHGVWGHCCGVAGPGLAGMVPGHRAASRWGGAREQRDVRRLMGCFDAEACNGVLRGRWDAPGWVRCAKVEGDAPKWMGCPKMDGTPQGGWDAARWVGYSEVDGVLRGGWGAQEQWDTPMPRCNGMPRAGWDA